MNKNKVSVILGIIAFAVLFSLGGFAVGKNIDNKDNAVDASKISNIASIKIADKQPMPTGTGYTLTLKNTSIYNIKQNSVYISYPIIIGNGLRMNNCKVEAIGNELDIKPNEEVTLFVFIPLENYKENESLDINRPQYELKGYFNKVIPINHFEQGGEF